MAIVQRMEHQGASLGQRAGFGRARRAPLRGVAFWLAALVAVLVGPQAAAQGPVAGEISATAAFRRDACYLGDQVELLISVDNADTVDPPDLSGIPGATFAFAGTTNESRTSVSIINGRRRESSVKRLVMRWVVTPDEPGSLIVPPVLVGVGGGQVAQSNEARLRVLEPEPETREVLALSVDETRVYVNQPVRVRVSWRLVSTIEDYSFRASRADDGLEIQPLEKPRRGNEQRYEIDLFGGRALGTLGYDTLDGQRVRAMEFELLVTPTRAGQLSLGPIIVSYDERIDRRSSRRMIARSEPLEFEVLEMPAAGRPEGFTGLLGTHGIEARAEPTSVSVGDPIGFEVTIFGPEPMAGVRDGPDLMGIPAFAEGFRIAGEGWRFRPGSRAGERTFSTTIRVTDPSVTEIPSIPLWFFDPDTGSYRRAQSEAIPLEVRAVREVTAADAVVAAAAPTGVSRDPLTATDAGLWGLDRGPSVLAQGDPLSGAFWREPAFIASAALPPAVFAVAGVVAVRRRTARSEHANRRARALRDAKRALNRDGSAAAVRVYLALAFGASPEAITGADGVRLLADAGVENPETIASIIEAHEAKAYGCAHGSDRTGEAGAAMTNQETAALLDRLDRSLRSRGRAAEGGSR